MRSDRRQMRVPRVLLAISTMLVWISQPGSALAECANPPSLEEALRAAPVAFVGEVTSAGVNADEATISVQWIWKGPDLPKELALRTPSTPAASGETGFRFRAGTTYIVLLEDTNGPYEVGECSGTRRYRGDGQVIPSELQLAAGASAGRAPGAPTEGAVADGGIGWAYIAVGAVLMIALMALAVRAYLRKRRSRPASDFLKRRIPAADGVMSSRRTSGDRQMQRLRRRSKN